MPKQSIKTILTCLAGVALLSGCADMTGLKPQGQLLSEQSVGATQSFTGVAPAPWPGDGWWRGLGGEPLDALIGEAFKENPDLAAADARVRQATAQTGLAPFPFGAFGLHGGDAARTPRRARSPRPP